MKQRGFINTIVLIVLALIVLGYYHIDIKTILQDPLVRSNLEYTRDQVLQLARDAWAVVFANVKYYLNL